MSTSTNRCHKTKSTRNCTLLLTLPGQCQGLAPKRSSTRDNVFPLIGRVQTILRDPRGTKHSTWNIQGYTSINNDILSLSDTQPIIAANPLHSLNSRPALTQPSSSSSRIYDCKTSQDYDRTSPPARHLLTGPLVPGLPTAACARHSQGEPRWDEILPAWRTYFRTWITSRETMAKRNLKYCMWPRRGRRSARRLPGVRNFVSLSL